MSHTEQFSTHVGERGKVVIPAPIRRHLGLEPGTPIILTVDKEAQTVTIIGREAATAQLRDTLPEGTAAGTVAELLARRQR